jgi:hypothetical protein
MQKIYIYNNYTLYRSENILFLETVEIFIRVHPLTSNSKRGDVNVKKKKIVQANTWEDSDLGNMIHGTSLCDHRCLMLVSNVCVNTNPSDRIFRGIKSPWSVNKVFISDRIE